MVPASFAFLRPELCAGGVGPVDAAADGPDGHAEDLGGWC